VTTLAQGPGAGRKVDWQGFWVGFLLLAGFGFWTWRIAQHAHHAGHSLPWYGWITGALAVALFFELVSSRYEQASLIVSSNKTFSAWGEIFGDPGAVAAMVDRLIHPRSSC